MKKVIILGGGLSGLTTAMLLSERGYDVSLYEARNHLGGRAYSFYSGKLGCEIDNGQHILMGCYKYTLELLKRCNGLDKLLIQKNLNLKYIDGGKSEYELKCKSLPAPFHILSGIFGFPFIKIIDILNFLSLTLEIFKTKIGNNNNFSAEDLLRRSHQRKEIKETLWYPIIISALNAKAKEVSGKLFADTMFELFYRKKSFSGIILPIAGLSDLFVKPLSSKIISRGGKIFTGKRIIDIIIEGKNVKSIVLSNGEVIRGDVFVSSLPNYDLLRLNKLESFLNFADIAKIKSSPIIGFYILLREKAVTDNILFFLRTKTQVLFNKSKICNLVIRDQLLSVVISAADDVINMSNEDLKNILIDDLQSRIKDFRVSDILSIFIIKEKRATSLFTPETNSLRPGTTTGLENFYLTGDWINTGLPSTIESAIKSAYIAEEAIVYKKHY